MTSEELRYLYQNRQLVEAVIETSEDHGAWIVEFRNQKGELVLLTDETGREQHYADPEQASLSALDIGFSQVRIANK